MNAQPITTQDLYNSIKSLIGKDSAYAVGKALGATNQAACNWRDGKHAMDDQYALRAALALGLDPDFVLACLAAERAQRVHQEETAAAWRRIATRLATAASICFVLIIPLLVMTNPA